MIEFNAREPFALYVLPVFWAEDPAPKPDPDPIPEPDPEPVPTAAQLRRAYDAWMARQILGGDA